MASYARCLFIIFSLILSFSIQTHSRESKFFSKVTKTTKKTHDSITISPAISPSLAPSPAPEAEVVERGYGLYGRDPYEYTPATDTAILGEEKYVPVDELSNNNKFYGNEYQYPPTTTNPTKSPVFGEEKYVPAEVTHSYNNGNERNGNGYVTEKQGMSDTRFMENGKYFYDVNNEEGIKGEKHTQLNANNYENEDFEEEKKGLNGNEKKGMSDTRFLENGIYFYDVKGEEGAKEEQNAHFNANNFENENFEEEKNGMDRYTQNKGNGNEKQGMSDTRFMENGKYYYDIGEEGSKMRNDHFNPNNNENNDHFENEKHGMSDTRFMENGKYYYDVNNEHGNSNNNNNNNNNNVHGNEEFLNKNDVKGYGYGNGNDEEEKYESNNEHVTGYNNNGNTKKFSDEYVTQGRQNNNFGNTKKLPNEYDTMEEYDREQGYIDPKDAYNP